MLSRTASELYWMSRHLERAENTARMLTSPRPCR
ncbi:alpha-E domain-containing protein [Aeromonas caviae]